MPETHSDADPRTRLIALAKADLADRLALSVAGIDLKQFKAVTWRDGSLGCPAPDGVYTQALVKGYSLVLSQGETDYHYHASAAGKPFLCPEGRRRPPLSAGSEKL